ncbi:MAG: TlyA family RNA methyltransferase, partial [Acidimicrobiales bacterium]
MRRRLDTELVRRGLVPSREQARARIEQGRVLVAGAPADKASRLVDAGEPVAVLGDPPPFVSRAGAKLAAALDRFAVDPAGRRALDAGASTGGFTDCLLQRGAARVVAVDVGHGQLHERLRADPRVVVHDRTNIRGFRLDEPVDLVVADLSFISLRTVAPAL